MGFDQLRVFKEIKKSDWVNIIYNDDFIVDYDKEHKRYRVSYFKDNHFKDEIIFDEYKDK